MNIWQTYAVTITCGLVIWYALTKTGLSKWVAWGAMFMLLVGTAAVAQFVVWPGRY